MTVSPAIAVWPSATSGADALRQVDIDARAEADHADALAGADAGALAHEADDAPRHQAGDLHHADARAAGRDHERVALVVLARLVEVGVDEGAGVVDDLARCGRRPGCGSRGSRTRS